MDSTAKPLQAYYDPNWISAIETVEERKIGTYSEDDPSTYPILELLSQRWTVKILRRLRQEPVWFNQLAREMRMNPNTLKARIRDLESLELITKIERDDAKEPQKYALTYRGFEITRAVDGILKWLQRNEFSPGTAAVVMEEAVDLADEASF